MCAAPGWRSALVLRRVGGARDGAGTTGRDRGGRTGSSVRATERREQACRVRPPVAARRSSQRPTRLGRTGLAREATSTRRRGWLRATSPAGAAAPARPTLATGSAARSRPRVPDTPTGVERSSGPAGPAPGHATKKATATTKRPGSRRRSQARTAVVTTDHRPGPCSPAASLADGSGRTPAGLRSGRRRRSRSRLRAPSPRARRAPEAGRRHRSRGGRVDPPPPPRRGDGRRPASGRGPARGRWCRSTSWLAQLAPPWVVVPIEGFIMPTGSFPACVANVAPRLEGRRRSDPRQRTRFGASDSSATRARGRFSPPQRLFGGRRGARNVDETLWPQACVHLTRTKGRTWIPATPHGC